MERITGFFTAGRLKKAGIGLLILMVVAGASGFFWHSYKTSERQRVMEARTRMIEVQAAQQNVILLDRDQVKALAAQAIGADPSAVTYGVIGLMEHDGSKRDDGRREHKKPMDKTKVTADQPAFQPIYMVNCTADKMRYNLRMDAVSGRILGSSIR